MCPMDTGWIGDSKRRGAKQMLGNEDVAGKRYRDESTRDMDPLMIL